MKRTRKCAFTLFEILVCLLIIVMIGTLVGIKGGQLLSHYRFRFSIQKILFDLRRLQVLAMTSGSDIMCHIQKKNDCYFFSFEGETSLVIQKQEYEMLGVGGVCVQGKMMQDIYFDVLASGRIIPYDVLTFTGKYETASCSLDCVYPRVIESPHKKITLNVPPYPKMRVEEGF